jgi:UDP-N-acetylmuramyl pentapeptide phosphotransferase/UDP-N-acetylglucosamine-1-phosphate transferase
MLGFTYAIDTKLAFCFGIAFLITYFLVPTVVEIARAKSLTAEPNGRSSHSTSVPTLGGLAIFTGVAISSLIFFSFTTFPKFQFTVAGLFIVFFAGFKDDLVGITPFKKLLAQLAACFIIIVFGNIRITNLHEFLGVGEVPINIGVLITVVTIVGITNCYNLMDGIDGLTASLGILASATFGTWFYLIGEYNWAMLAVSLMGALLAFFIFNVFGRKNKIFMGDTGSLVLGYIIAVMAIEFNEFNVNLTGPYAIHAAPAVSIGIIMIPFFDTLRVFFTRILQNKHPFTPDKSHLHHYLLDLGLSHILSTIVIILMSIIIIIASFLLQDLTTAWLLIVLMAMAAGLSYIPITIVEMKKRKGKKVTE